VILLRARYKYNHILSSFLYRATNFIKNGRLLWVKNSNPKRPVAEYCIVNRDMINGTKNIDFSLSIAIQYLPLGKFAVLMIAVRTEYICAFLLSKNTN